MREDSGDRPAGAGGGFGGLLRAYRERALLSQEQLAERSGLSTRTIRNLEQGRTRSPRGGSIRLLADALGLAGARRSRFEEAARPALLPELAEAAAPVAVPRQLPPDIADFVGRSAPVERLQALLGGRSGGADDGSRVPLVVCAVAGKAGVGKSALAVHVAHRLATHYRDGQLYASLGGGGTEGWGPAGRRPLSPLDPAEVLSRFLRALGVDGGAIPDALEERMALYRSRTAGRRVLVVLDDAAGEAQLRPLLPGGPAAAVLITGRTRLAALEGAHLVQLDVLDPDPAVALLARVAGPRRVAAEPDAAATIVAACGRLPLAVRVAGARLAARPHWPLARMAGLLADERCRLDELAHGDLGVRASLSLSYQGLADEQRWLFRRLGLLHAPDLPAWVAAALLDRPPAQAEERLEELTEAQLVDLAGWDATGRPRYRLHELLRAYALERLQAEEPAAEQQAALERALSGWASLADRADQRLPVGSLVGGRVAVAGWRLEAAAADELVADPLAWFEAERAALVTAVHQASTLGAAGTEPPAGKLAWRLAGSMAPFFQLRTYREDYQTACERSLAAARRGGDRRGEAWMLLALAELFGDRDQMDEALDLAGRARLLHQQVGDRHGEAYAWFIGADLRRIRGELAGVDEDLEQAWRRYSALGDEQGRAWVLHDRGRLRRQQGNLDEAGDLLAQALTASRIGGDRRVEALVLHGLALVHQGRGEQQLAVPCLLQSLRICRELGDGLGEGFVLRTLGDVRRDQGRNDEAAAALRQALVVLRRIGARRGEAVALQSLGELESAQDRPHDALALLEAALAVQRGLGNLPAVARTLAAIAEVQAATGDHAAAEHSRSEAGALSLTLGLPPAPRP